MKKIFDKIVENGIILSLFLGLAYLLLYRYQRGKLSYYDIPLVYIDLSLSNVIEIFVTILFAAYLVYLVLKMMIDATPQIKQYKIRKMILITAAYMVFISISLVVIGSWSLLCSSLTIIYAVYILVNFISPLFIKNKKLSYREKWAINSKAIEKQDLKENEQRNTGFFAKISSGVFKIGLVICVLYFSSNLFGLAGEQTAKTMDEYYIAKDYDNQVVVHYTEDIYILMPYEDGLLENEYLIVPTEDIGKLSREKIGVLKLKG